MWKERDAASVDSSSNNHTSLSVGELMDQKNTSSLTEHISVQVHPIPPFIIYVCVRYGPLLCVIHTHLVFLHCCCFLVLSGAFKTFEERDEKHLHKKCNMAENKLSFKMIAAQSDRYVTWKVLAFAKQGVFSFFFIYYFIIFMVSLFSASWFSS